MIYAFDQFTIDTDAFEIRRDGELLSVEPQVLELLMLLVKHHDRVLSKDELFAQIWRERVVSDTTLSSRIKSARRLLGDDGSRQRYIRTVYGRGFRFVREPTVRPYLQEPASLPAELEHAGRFPRRHDDATAAATSRPRTRYAKSGDVHVAYQLFGDGPVDLVLVPGFVSHIDHYWDDPRLAHWLNELGGFARVAMFDKRGTGLSDQVPDLPGMDERMDDVRAVMDAVGFERAAILGISEGGSLATLFSATHPGRCQALVVYGGFARFTSWFPTEESLQELYDYIESHWGTGISLPKFAPSMAGDPEFARWWGQFERLGANPGAATALMRMNSQIDLSDILSSIRVPTLIIHRGEDVLIDVEGGRTLARDIPNARYVELRGSDHLPWVGEDSPEITRAVRKFLLDAPDVDTVERVLATLLVLMVGSPTPLPLGHADERALRELLARYRGEAPIVESGCYLMTFDGPGRALQCAREIVASLGREGEPVRVGLHTGEVEIRLGSIQGLAVQIATAIAQAAAAQEVLVSRTVNDLVAGSGVELIDAGARAVDGMPADWRLYRIGGD